MPKQKLSLAGELTDLEELFTDLSSDFSKQAVLKELSIQISLEKAFQQFKVEFTSSDQLDQQTVFQKKLEKLRSVVVNEEQIKDAFLKLKPQLDRFSLGFIRVAEEKLAQELYRKLTQEQQDFKALATKYSTGPEAKNGGLIKPISLSSLNPKVSQKLKNLRKEQILEPFLVEENLYLIVKVFGIENAVLSEKVSTNLSNRLFKKWLDSQVELNDLKLVT